MSIMGSRSMGMKMRRCTRRAAAVAGPTHEDKREKRNEEWKTSPATYNYQVEKGSSMVFQVHMSIPSDLHSKSPQHSETSAHLCPSSWQPPKTSRRSPGERRVVRAGRSSMVIVGVRLVIGVRLIVRVRLIGATVRRCTRRDYCVEHSSSSLSSTVKPPSLPSPR